MISSRAAIRVAKDRLGFAAAPVHWITGDITSVELEAARYDLWHDRAVFHFLTSADDRAAYVRQVARAVRLGGHVIVATFGLDGPERCSGLDCRSLRRRKSARRVRPEVPSVGQRHGVARDPLGDASAVHVLLLSGGMS